MIAGLWQMRPGPLVTERSRGGEHGQVPMREPPTLPLITFTLCLVGCSSTWPSAVFPIEVCLSVAANVGSMGRGATCFTNPHGDEFRIRDRLLRHACLDTRPRTPIVEEVVVGGVDESEAEGCLGGVNAL